MGQSKFILVAPPSPDLLRRSMTVRRPELSHRRRAQAATAVIPGPKPMQYAPLSLYCSRRSMVTQRPFLPHRREPQPAATAAKRHPTPIRAPPPSPLLDLPAAHATTDDQSGSTGGHLSRRPRSNACHRPNRYHRGRLSVATAVKHSTKSICCSPPPRSHFFAGQTRHKDQLCITREDRKPRRRSNNSQRPSPSHRRRSQPLRRSS